jgi:hypothetical protein
VSKEAVSLQPLHQDKKMTVHFFSPLPNGKKSSIMGYVSRYSKLYLKNKAGAAFPDDARDSFCFDFF